MTNEHELDRLLDAFFAEGTDELADRLIDAALDQIDHTKQRRPMRAPRRFATMKMSARLAVAAAIGVLAVGGLIYVGRPTQPAVGSPSSAPGPSSLPGSSPRPSNVASPSASPSVTVIVPRPPAWIAAAGMPQGRYLHTATLLADGKVLIAGGSTDGRNALASAELFDPVGGSWTATGTMVSPRESQTATLLPNGKVLVAGGYRDFEALPSAELYDPATGTWAATGSMNNARGYHTATLLPDGKVLVAGGRSNNSSTGGPLTSAELYDPASGTWKTTDSLLKAHMYHTATLLIDGQVLVAGANFKGYGLDPAATAELYDPATGSWKATGPMITAGDFQAATLLADGHVLVAGGTKDSAVGCCSVGAQLVATGQLYDPNTGTWAQTGDMLGARARHTATLLAGGKVLVTGGESTSGTSLKLSELYDPATGLWTATASMAGSRSLAVATLLSDGGVLLTGGFSGGKGLPTVELYDPGNGN